MGVSSSQAHGNSPQHLFYRAHLARRESHQSLKYAANRSRTRTPSVVPSAITVDPPLLVGVFRRPRAAGLPGVGPASLIGFANQQKCKKDQSNTHDNEQPMRWQNMRGDAPDHSRRDGKDERKRGDFEIDQVELTKPKISSIAQPPRLAAAQDGGQGEGKQS